MTLFHVSPAHYRGGLLAVAVTSAIVLPAQAAPETLSFTMTARLSYKDGSASPAPAQVVDAKVWMAGSKARLETTLGGRPMTVLYSPPYAYRLLPSSKIGQKYRADRVPQLANLLPGANTSSLDPSKIRAALVKGGARKTGTAVVSGTPVDVYSAARFRNRPDRITAYLRRSDALPLRVTLDSKNFSAVASWRNYRIGANMPASLFAVPQGYRIREARTPR